jgi:hypothetical protein
VDARAVDGSPAWGEPALLLGSAAMVGFRYVLFLFLLIADC